MVILKRKNHSIQFGRDRGLKRQIPNLKQHMTEKYENKIFIRLVLLVATPLLILGIVTGIYSTSLQMSRNNLMLESAQKNAQTQVDTILTNLRGYYLGVVKNAEYSWLSSCEEPPYSNYTKISRVQEQLSGGSIFYRNISGYTYINVKNGWVLSNLGAYRLSEVRNRDELQTFIDAQNNIANDIFWVNNTGVSPSATGNYRVDLSGYQLVLRATTPMGEITDLLIVRINLVPLMELASSWKGLNYEVAFVENSTNKSIFYTNADFAQQLSYAPKVSGIYNWGDWKLCVGNLTTNGIRCYAGENQSNAFVFAGTTLMIAVAVAVATILLLLICRWSSAALYSPIQELMVTVSGVFGQRKHDQDEFSYLASGAAQMANNQRELEYMATMQQQKLCEQFMLHMIRGEMSQSEIERGLQDLEVKQFAVYRLLKIAIEGGRNSDTIAMTLVQTLPEEVTDTLFLRPLPRDAAVILVIGAREESVLSEKVQHIFHVVSDIAQNLWQASCKGGASLAFTSPSRLNSAYFEALEALRRNVTQDSDLLTYYTPPDEGYASSGYDMLLQNEILTALSNCNRNGTRRLIVLVVERVEQDGTRGYERQFYQQRLTSAMLSVAENAGLSVGQVLSDRESGLFDQISKIYDGEKLQEFWMNDVAVPIMDMLTNFRQNTSSELVKNVIALIKQTNGDITLNECAEQLNYHPSYIWKILKSERDTNFTNLVNAQKLEMAKEMLLTTDLTVAQVAESLHYSNVQNFIRFFSREVGMTPGKYKKEHRSPNA